MKKLIVLALVLFVLFGLSAGSSWMLQQNGLLGTSQEEAKESEAEKGGKQASSGHGGPGASSHEPGAALRPNYSVDNDAAGALLISIKNAKEAVTAKEKTLVNRQKEIDLILADIRIERTVIEDLRKQLDEEMKIAAARMEQLERAGKDNNKLKQKIEAEKADLDGEIIEFEAGQKESYKHLAQIYESSDPEATAETFQRLADGGKMDIVAKVLTIMGERKAGKILAAMSDRTTAGQLTEAMLRIMNRKTAGGGRSQ